MGSDLSRIIMNGINDPILKAGALAKLPEGAEGQPDLSDPQVLMDKIHACLAEGHSSTYKTLSPNWQQVPQSVRQPRQLGGGSMNPQAAHKVADPPAVPRPAYPSPQPDHSAGRDKRAKLSATTRQHVEDRGCCCCCSARRYQEAACGGIP
jgi:hypothetical protein